MNRCSKCNKLIWFWNKFNRNYGYGFLYKEGTPLDKPLFEIVRFCSEKCCFAYKKDKLIDFNKISEKKI